jgi:hypothetical protein
MMRSLAIWGISAVLLFGHGNIHESSSSDNGFNANYFLDIQMATPSPEDQSMQSLIREPHIDKVKEEPTLIEITSLLNYKRDVFESQLTLSYHEHSGETKVDELIEEAWFSVKQEQYSFLMGRFISQAIGGSTRIGEFIEYPLIDQILFDAYFRVEGLQVTKEVASWKMRAEVFGKNEEILIGSNRFGVGGASFSLSRELENQSISFLYVGYNSENRLFEAGGGHGHEHAKNSADCITGELGENCIDNTIDYAAFSLSTTIDAWKTLGSVYVLQERAIVETKDFLVDLENNAFGLYLQSSYTFNKKWDVSLRGDYHQHGYEIIGSGASSVQESLGLVNINNLHRMTTGISYKGFNNQKLRLELIRDNVYADIETRTVLQYLVSF